MWNARREADQVTRAPRPTGGRGTNRPLLAHRETGGGHAAALSVMIASTAAIRWPIQAITGTAMLFPSAL